MKSHIFVQTTHVALPHHQSCHGGGVLDIINYAMFRQNRFRGSGFLRGQNLLFSYAWHYGLYNSLELPPNL